MLPSLSHPDFPMRKYLTITIGRGTYDADGRRILQGWGGIHNAAHGGHLKSLPFTFHLLLLARQFFDLLGLLNYSLGGERVSGAILSRPQDPIVSGVN